MRCTNLAGIGRADIDKLRSRAVVGGNQAKGLDDGHRGGSSTEYPASSSPPAAVCVACEARPADLESWTADRDAEGGSVPSGSAPVKEKSEIMRYIPIVHSWLLMIYNSLLRPSHHRAH